MNKTYQEIEELAVEIDRLAQEKRYAANLLQAFGPLLMGQRRWLSIPRETTCTFPVDPVKYHSGISLLQQGRLLQAEDPWQEAGLSIAEAIAQGFPHIAEDMQRIAHPIREQEMDCFTLCHGAGDKEQLAQTAKRLEIEAVSLQFFQRSLIRWMLAKKAQDMRPHLVSLSWKKGYCPICASFPHLAIIREQGQRWLQCSTCNHEWLFPRLTCPYCGHEDPQETHTLFVEGRGEEFAFTCGKCSRYLVTSNQSGNLRREPADLLAFTLVHLDYILQEKGFLPMAACEFNTFDQGRVAG